MILVILYQNIMNAMQRSLTLTEVMLPWKSGCNANSRNAQLIFLLIFMLLNVALLLTFSRKTKPRKITENKLLDHTLYVKITICAQEWPHVKEYNRQYIIDT